MKNNRNICLIITMYETKEKYIKYWSQEYKKILYEGYEIYFINDDPRNDFSNHFKVENYIQNKVNLGKFQTIYNFIKGGNVKSKYVKIIDNDDLILIDELNSVDNLLYNENSDIITMPSYRFNPEQWENIFDKIKNNNFNSKIFDKNIEIVNNTNFGTSWTILNKKSILNDSYYKDDMNAKTFLEDQLLGLISFIGKCTRKYIDKNFVLYSRESGVSKIINKISIIESIDNLNNYWTISIESGILPKSVFPGNLNYMKSKIHESFENEVIDEKFHNESIEKINKLTFDSKINSEAKIIDEFENHYKITKM